MQDYPDDAGQSMSQAWHGSKIQDLPTEHCSQTAYWEGKIFWLRELTECSDGSFFIPERYFYAPGRAGDDSEGGLLALGWDVVASKVNTN